MSGISCQVIVVYSNSVSMSKNRIDNYSIRAGYTYIHTVDC